jgi:tetratricopeptide (TPR) repeat protein
MKKDKKSISNKILVTSGVVMGILLLSVVITYVMVNLKKTTSSNMSIKQNVELKSTTTEIMNVFNSGDYTKAIGLADAYLKEHPNDAQVLAAKATILANKGSVEFDETNYAQQAIEVANKALSLSSNLPEALYARGYAYEIQNQFDEAIADYKLVLQQVSDNPVYLTQMGHAYDLKGESEKAKEYYEKALAIDENYGKALINMGRYEIRYGDKGKAQEYFEKSLTYINNEIEKAGVYYSLGMLDLGQDKIKDGYNYMKQAVKIAPEYPQALIGRGWAGILLMTQEDSDLEKLLEEGISFQSVFEDVEKAVTINPNQTVGYVTLARMYLRIPNLTKKSLDYYDQALGVVDMDNTIMSNDRETVKKDIIKEKESAEKIIAKKMSLESGGREKVSAFKVKNIFRWFHGNDAMAGGVWRGNCYIGDGAEADYCYDSKSFTDWITLLNLNRHVSVKINDYYYYCNNGSPIYLVACGSANGKTLATRPTTHLCINSQVDWKDQNAYDKTWNWDCKGSSSAGEGAIHCSANRQYTCTGTRPIGSHVCSGSDSGLSVDTAWHKTDDCSTAGKCAYYYQCTGNPPSGATVCTGDSTGLTSDITWRQVFPCTSARKCEFTVPAGCGPADNGEYVSTAKLRTFSTCPPGATETNFVDNSGLVSGAGWTWNCTKANYATSSCSAKKKGECEVSANGPFNSLSDACKYGAFHSVYLDGGILKWTCGSGDGSSGSPTYHIGSFETNNAAFGAIVSPDQTPMSTSCFCKPSYVYSCVDGGYTKDCSKHCGETNSLIRTPVKTDTDCFPNEHLSVTEAEYNCPDQSVQCPPCGVNAGESGTINEVN